jgi:hypothetical protein
MQVVNLHRLDDSPAQRPYLLPGPRTPVALATHYRLSLGLRFTPSSHPVTPLGSQPPFSVGQSLNPYRHHYSTAFASSRSFTRCTIPRTYAWATRPALAGREYNGLTTFRKVYQQTGLGRLCTPGEATRAAGDR